MCVTGGEQRKLNADACNVRRPLAGALSDNRSRQGGEQQHGADAEQDDILEYELTGEVPGYRVSRQAPVNDTWRRKEEWPRNGKRNYAHQRADGREDRAECACREKRRNAQLGNAKEICFSPEAEYR